MCFSDVRLSFVLCGALI